MDHYKGFQNVTLITMIADEMTTPLDSNFTQNTENYTYTILLLRLGVPNY